LGPILVTSGPWTSLRPKRLVIRRHAQKAVVARVLLTAETGVFIFYLLLDKEEKIISIF
jgi:hypothetical protein